jgi:gliding motility-associated protein GldM
MSIPKEPRQLMINLMYLVLTALLALNVSAEVMNAFFSLDKGLKSSMNIVENSNVKLTESIARVAEAYKNPENAKYSNNAKEAQRISADFVSYIETIRTNLFEKAKGPSKKDPTIPKDIKNKDLTTKMFITDGLAAEIEAKINETRKALLELADNDQTTSDAMPLKIEDVPPTAKAKTWVDYKFKQMPVAAVFPTLAKLQSDAKSASSAVLNYCAQKVSGEKEIRFDKYAPVISANKSYLIRGEQYEAEVFLGAYSSQSDNIRISVNGGSLPVSEGKAKYSARAEGLGNKKVSVSINVINPLSKETKTYTKDFEYEVGQRSIAVQLDKMNVFYIGVDNPITVSAAGLNSNQVRVSGSGGGISISGSGSGRTVRVNTPGEATLTVSGEGVSQTFNYRVKRIPDPIPKLGAQHQSKAMGSGEFAAQSGIAAVLENFDFDVKCEIAGFTAVYLQKRGDPSPPKTNGGARFNEDIASMVRKAKPGDAYFFDDIKAKCPGDGAARNIGGLAFKIR